MSTFHEYLDTFKLSEAFSIEELKKAYYSQAQLFHPDRYTNPEDRKAAAQEFQKVQEAYLFLKKLLDERKKSEEAFVSIKEGLSSGAGARPEEFWAAGNESEEKNSLGLLVKLFGLDGSAYSLLLSLLVGLCEGDVEDIYHPIWSPSEERGASHEEEERAKELWTSEWQDAVRKMCLSRTFKPRPTIWNDRSKEFQDALKTLRTSTCPFLRELLGLEIAAFDLYWPLANGTAQTFPGLTVVRQRMSEFYETALKPLGLTGDFIFGLRDSLEKSMQAMHPSWNALFKGVSKNGRGTLFGAALTAVRDLSLTPAGNVPRNGCSTPEMVALAGAGLRLWIKDDPKFLVIGGGGALVSPVCGDDAVFLGLWSLPEVLLSLAKIQVFMQEILPRNKKYGFCSARLVELLKKLPLFLENVASRAGSDAQEKIETIKTWVRKIAG